MVMLRSFLTYLVCLVPLALGAAASAATPEIEGKALLEKNCARCHAIAATGDSPLEGAPPLRDRVAIQYWSALTISPLLIVLNALQTSGLRVFLTNRTLPSAMRAFTPLG